jgi:hypothetical protein
MTAAPTFMRAYLGNKSGSDDLIRGENLCVLLDLKSDESGLAVNYRDRRSVKLKNAR